MRPARCWAHRRHPAALEATAGAWADTDWARGPLRKALREAGSRTEVRGRQLFQPVRIALTGRLSGPELPDVAFVLGRDRTLERLRRALDRTGAVTGHTHE